MKMNYQADAMWEECKVVGALPNAGLAAAVQLTRLQLQLQCLLQWAVITLIHLVSLDLLMLHFA